MRLRAPVAGSGHSASAWLPSANMALAACTSWGSNSSAPPCANPATLPPPRSRQSQKPAPPPHHLRCVLEGCQWSAGRAGSSADPPCVGPLPAPPSDRKSRTRRARLELWRRFRQRQLSRPPIGLADVPARRLCRAQGARYTPKNRVVAGSEWWNHLRCSDRTLPPANEEVELKLCQSSAQNTSRW